MVHLSLIAAASAADAPALRIEVGADRMRQDDDVFGPARSLQGLSAGFVLWTPTPGPSFVVRSQAGGGERVRYDPFAAALPWSSAQNFERASHSYAWWTATMGVSTPWVTFRLGAASYRTANRATQQYLPAGHLRIGKRSNPNLHITLFESPVDFEGEGGTIGFSIPVHIEGVTVVLNQGTTFAGLYFSPSLHWGRFELKTRLVKSVASERGYHAGLSLSYTVQLSER